MATKNLGAVTAYAYAVAGGYTGTEAEFEEALKIAVETAGEGVEIEVTDDVLTITEVS